MACISLCRLKTEKDVVLTAKVPYDFILALKIINMKRTWSIKYDGKGARDAIIMIKKDLDLIQIK